MTDLMLRRRAMMMETAAPELYPVGTNIKALYLTGNPANWIINKKYSTTTGELIDGTSGYYASDIYVPVKPQYRFRKNGYRITGLCWYDKDKVFISGSIHNNTTAGDLPAPPSNAAFFRISTGNSSNVNSLQVIRTA